jgi:hypothetical protein
MILATACIILMAAPLAAMAQEDDSPGQAPKGLMKRIDFGTARILGQSIKSGAVYLMHRKKSDIKNMLEVRENYREEIIEDYGLEKTAIAPGDDAQSEDQR